MIYKEGVYLTHPTFGPPTALRKVRIAGRIVEVLDGLEYKVPEQDRRRGFHRFTQADFFSVNTMVGPAN